MYNQINKEIRDKMLLYWFYVKLKYKNIRFVVFKDERVQT